MDCLSAQLTGANSALSNLSSLTCHHIAETGEALGMRLLPPAASALTALRCLDITDKYVPAAVSALTGQRALHHIVIWGLERNCSACKRHDWCKMSTLCSW